MSRGRKKNDFLFEFMLQSQMEELENKHTSEVAKLQKQIDALDNQIIRLQMSNSKRYAQSRTSEEMDGTLPPMNCIF